MSVQQAHHHRLSRLSLADGAVGTIQRTPEIEPGFDLGRYRRVLVAFSGGKDSLAALLHLLDIGVTPTRIELHHHEVDGGGPTFMDWPITPAYVAALARHFRLPLYRSWREGGFRREMDRDGTPTAPILFETSDGPMRRSGGAGPPGVRRRFPQVSADLSVRWCSSSLKIDVLAAAIRGQARFEGEPTLVVTGERAEESPARARYKTSRRTGHPAGDGRWTTGVLSWAGARGRSGAGFARPASARIPPTAWAGRG